LRGPGHDMSIHELKARSLVPAVPKREPAGARDWLVKFLALGREPQEVPGHLREDVGLPPPRPSIFDYPLIDLGRNGRRKDEWMD